MRAGDLRHRIKIEKRTDVINSVGQNVPTWSAFAFDVPADYQPERGSEYFSAKGLVVSKPALFVIRDKPGVVEQMRVQFRGEVWDIGFVDDVNGRRREMHLYCATGLNEG